ncbi:MAG: hypothetical protein M3373_14050 [Gemmatimonadota bacterium]|nr:hypothetical protein [Gemmatimonadota bacterium]
MRRRIVLTVSGILSAVSLGVAPVSAQGGEEARGVTLRIQPRTGDTIRTRLEQRVEMTATRSSSTAHRDSAVAMRSATATIALLRNVVQRSERDVTTLLLLLDSVAITGTGARLPSEEERRAIQGRRLQVRITAQGAVTLLDPPDVSGSIAGQPFTRIPAMLPDGAVAVGEQWARSLAIPLAGAQEGKEALRVRAVFRLDSLVRNSELAFVSIRGTVLGDTTRDQAPGTKRFVSGSMHGTLVVDRRRGWIADSFTTIFVRSDMSAAATPGGPPLRVDVRVTQRMRTTGDQGSGTSP